jgi:hypothetical protein
VKVAKGLLFWEGQCLRLPFLGVGDEEVEDRCRVLLRDGARKEAWCKELREALEVRLLPGNLRQSSLDKGSHNTESMGSQRRASMPMIDSSRSPRGKFRWQQHSC